MDTSVFDDAEEVKEYWVSADGEVKTEPRARHLSVETVQALSDAGWYLHHEDAGEYVSDYFSREEEERP